MSVSICYETLAGTLKKLKSTVRNLAKDKKLPKEYNEAVESLLAEYAEVVSPKNAANVTEEVLDALSINMRQSVLNLMNTARSLNENRAFVKDLLALGSENKVGIKEKMDAPFERTRINVESEIRWYNNNLESSFDNLYQRGEIDRTVTDSAKKAFLSAISGGEELNKIFKKYGIEDNEQIQALTWQAISEGKYKGIPELHAIAKVFKGQEEAIASRLQTAGVPFKQLAGHVAKQAGDRQTLLNMGFDNYKKIADEVFNYEEIFKRKNIHEFGQEDIDSWLKERFERKTEVDTYGLPKKKKTNLGHSREAVFNNDGRSELAYFKATNPIDTDVLRAVFSHRQNLLKNAKLYELHGANLSMAIENMAKVFLDDPEVGKILGSDKLRFTEKYMRELGEDVGLLRSSTSDMDQTVNTAVKTISNLASAQQTGFAAVRQFINDGSVHTAFQASALKGTSPLAEWAGAMSGQINHMTKVKKTKELAAMFEDMGVAMAFSTNHLTQGLLSEEKLLRTSRWERYSHNIAEWHGKVTLSDWLYKSQRVHQSQHVSSILERSFADGWGDMEPIMKRMFREAGVTESVFKQLADAPKLKFEGSIVGIDFKKMGASELTPFQSVKQNVAAARTSYITVHSKLLNDLVTSRTLRGRVTSDWAPKGAVARLIFKYWGINLDQYRSFLRLNRLAAGLDPDVGDIKGLGTMALTGRGVYRLGQALPSMMASGIMYQWIRDLADGREPRDITGHALAQAMSFTGWGGVYGLMAQDIFYNQDVISSPLGGAVDVGRGIVKATMAKRGNIGGTAARGAKRLIPGANLWFTSMAYDKLLYDGLGARRTRREKRRDKKRGNPSFILDN